jgi:hypothetical protein
VRGQQNQLSARVFLLHQLVQHAAPLLVQPGVGFIKQQNPWVAQQRPCDGQPLFHSTRKAPHRNRARVCQPDSAHEFAQVSFAVAGFIQQGIEAQILTACQVFV